MRGIIFAILAGACITLQGVANSRISEDIGTWQAATVTQFIGFAAALFILLITKDQGWREYKKVYPLYLTGGALAPIVIVSTIAGIQLIGVTFTTAAFLIAQLSMTFLIDGKGWFGVTKEQMRLPQFIGIAMMVVGVLILNL